MTLFLIFFFFNEACLSPFSGLRSRLPRHRGPPFATFPTEKCKHCHVLFEGRFYYVHSALRQWPSFPISLVVTPSPFHWLSPTKTTTVVENSTSSSTCKIGLREFDIGGFSFFIIFFFFTRIAFHFAPPSPLRFSVSKPPPPLIGERNFLILRRDRRAFAPHSCFAPSAAARVCQCSAYFRVECCAVT